jgi:hypothetical protein
VKRDGTPMLARTGVTSPFGKLDGRLERTRIESFVKDEFSRRKRTLTNKPDAEVIRDFVRVAALGREEAVRVYGDSVLVVVRLVEGTSDKQQ